MLLLLLFFACQGSNYVKSLQSSSRKAPNKRSAINKNGGGPCVFHFLPNRIKENAEILFFSSLQIIKIDDASNLPLGRSKGTGLLRRGKGALDCLELFHISEDVFK